LKVFFENCYINIDPNRKRSNPKNSTGELVLATDASKIRVDEFTCETKTNQRPGSRLVLQVYFTFLFRFILKWVLLVIGNY
jgi:hypothetical protein